LGFFPCYIIDFMLKINNMEKGALVLCFLCVKKARSGAMFVREQEGGSNNKTGAQWATNLVSFYY